MYNDSDDYNDDTNDSDNDKHDDDDSDNDTITNLSDSQLPL